MDLSLLTKAELDQLLPLDQRWEPDQLRRVRRDELLADVAEFQKQNGNVPQEVSIILPRIPSSNRELKLIPMKLLTIRNKEQITSAAEAVFELRGADPVAWNFTMTKYSDDRGTRLEIQHMQLGLVEIYWTSKGYTFRISTS